VVWAIKREQTHAREALSQATNELSRLNATLQQRVADQLVDLEYRNKQLEFSLAVIRTANESLELEALLKKSVNLIHDEFGLHHVSILLLDDTTRFVVVQEATGAVGQQLKTEGYRLGLGSQSLVGQATQRRQAQHATNTAEDPFFQRHPLLPETNSELALPLITRGYLVGALDMQSRDADAFTPQDITVLQLIADQLANSIDNALLFKQLEKRTEQMTELQTITSLMTLQNDVQSTLNVLAQRAKTLLQADGTGVFLWREETNKLELVLNIDIGANIIGYNLDPDEGLAGLSFREGETYVIDNYNTWSGRLEAFAEADFQALMTVPLKERDRPIGVLSLIRRTPDHPFNVEEIQLIELLAAQAGTIITNQELFENLHVLVQRERVLNKITAEVRHSLNADTIVESAAQQLGEVLGNKQVHVRLYPPQERYMRPDITKTSHG
jgi:GAF domain-containing protein